jgi:hypothetical protein
MNQHSPIKQRTHTHTHTQQHTHTHTHTHTRTRNSYTSTEAPVSLTRHISFVPKRCKLSGGISIATDICCSSQRRENASINDTCNGHLPSSSLSALRTTTLHVQCISAAIRLMGTAATTIGIRAVRLVPMPLLTRDNGRVSCQSELFSSSAPDGKLRKFSASLLPQSESGITLLHPFHPDGRGRDSTWRGPRNSRPSTS